MLGRVRQQTDWMVELLRSTEGDEPEISVVDLADAVEGPCLATPAGVPYDVTFVKVDGTGVLVDPVGLKRSAWNLMDNARRAVAHGGTVEVRVGRHHRDAVLEVADSGPGFGRLPTQQGHGLVGVRRFAKRFGGDICVGASSLGGALVTLRLPLALGHAAGCRSVACASSSATTTACFSRRWPTLLPPKVSRSRQPPPTPRRRWRPSSSTTPTCC